jgi:hypothetical protein
MISVIHGHTGKKKLLQHYGPLFEQFKAKLPSWYATEKLRQEKLQELRNTLGVQEIYHPDTGKAIGARLSVKGIISFLIQHYNLPAGPVRFKFSLDARPNGKRGELVVCLVPYFGKRKTQSGNNIFPIAILEGTCFQCRTMQFNTDPS